MKISLSIAILCMGWSVLLAEEYYPTVFDTLDVDAIISNERLVKMYIDCLFEKGACTADARALKRFLPDAIATHCRKCTDIQKSNARKVLNHLRFEKPEVWIKLMEKYDPQGQNTQNFEIFLNGETSEEYF